MNNMKTLWALIRKDLKLFAVDRTAMIISFLVPIGIACFMAVIFGGMGGDGKMNKIDVLIVDQDDSATTREIFESLNSGDAIAPSKASVEKARDKVRKGKVGVAVVFPKGFGKEAERAMFYGNKPTLQLLTDPSKQTEAQIVQGRLVESIMNVVSKRSFNPDSSKGQFDEAIANLQKSKNPDKEQITALKDMQKSLKKLGVAEKKSGSKGSTEGLSVPFETKNEQIESPKAESGTAQITRSFGGMAVQGLLFQAINQALGILQDKKRGIWKRLQASPTTRVQVFIGKLVSTFLVTLAILLAVFFVGFLAFKFHIGGSVLGFALVCVATAAMAAGFGMFVAAMGKTEEQSRGFSILAVLLMCMLGGAWFPSFLMPKAVQTIANIVPVRWAMDGFDASTWRGVALADCFPAIGVLMVFAVVFSAISWLRFRKA